MNKAITEYRKASAEALGLVENPYHPDSEYYRVSGWPVFDKDKPEFEKWHPDKDAEQMLMVWDWLKEKGYKGLETIDDIIAEYLITEIDIRLTTMKAFMEYIKIK